MDGVVAPVVVQALDAVAIPRPLAKIEAVTLAELESVAHVRWTESRITAHRDPGHDIRHFLHSNNGGPERRARPEGDFLSEFQRCSPRLRSRIVAPRSPVVGDR